MHRSLYHLEGGFVLPSWIEPGGLLMIKYSVGASLLRGAAFIAETIAATASTKSALLLRLAGLSSPTY